jgi:4-amino-4-deoxy-L-arabinose transferase-like glycosyltransferase
VWVGAAPWVTAWVVTSLGVAMLYRVVTDLIDGVAGLLAAVMALSLEDLRIAAFMTMSHMVMLLLLLLAVAAYVRWRRQRRVGWAVVIGVLAGWSAITRPMDAICFVLPLIGLMVWDLRRDGWRSAVGAIAVVSVAAVPFVGLELVFDKGVTGRWLKAPVTMYNDVNLPGHSMGLGPGAHLPPSPSHLQQVRDYHVEMVESYLRLRASAGFFETWIRDRLLPSADVAFPAHVMFVLVPMGFLALRRRPVVCALVVGLILLPLAYTFWTSFFAHYGLILLPAFFALALLGAEVLRATFPTADGAIALGILLLALGGMPVVRPNLDRYPRSDMLLDVKRKLARLDHVPAVVLFRYETGGSSIHEEPVYNIDAGWPDDERVIRAHDLGPRNVEIFSYYAARQPERFFYRYDRTSRQLTPLGRAVDLARAATTH